MTRAYPLPGYPLQLPPYRVEAGPDTNSVALIAESQAGKPLSGAGFQGAAIAMTPAYFGKLYGRPPYFYGGDATDSVMSVIAMPKPMASSGLFVAPPPKACIISIADRCPAIDRAVYVAALKAGLQESLEAANIWCAIAYPVDPNFGIPASSTSEATGSVSVTWNPQTTYSGPAYEGQPSDPDQEFAVAWDQQCPVVEAEKWVGREVLYIVLVGGGGGSGNEGGTFLSSSIQGEFDQFGTSIIPTIATQTWTGVQTSLVVHDNTISLYETAYRDTFSTEIFDRSKVMIALVSVPDDTPEILDLTPATEGPVEDGSGRVTGSFTDTGTIVLLSDYLAFLATVKTAISSAYGRLATASGGVVQTLNVAYSTSDLGADISGNATAPAVIGWIRTFFGV